MKNEKISLKNDYQAMMIDPKDINPDFVKKSCKY